MILVTAEVRWFFRGAPPARVWRWFRRGDLWAPQPNRIDEYLVLPGCATAGIKLREDRFEVKAQTALPEATEYPGGVRGYCEGWVKWSRYAGRAAGARSFLVAGDEEWVKVAKARTLRGFSFDGVGGGGDPREVNARRERPSRGCAAEITELEVLAPPASSWWTLGLEGFDPGGDASACLERGAHVFFAAAPAPIDLDLDASRSYAGWLSSGLWSAKE